MMLSGESLSPFLDAGDLTAATLGFLKGDAAIAPAAPAPPAALTLREADVLRLLARGRTNKEIAQELTISVSTAERHVANIYRKIGARGRAEATAYAITNGVR
jgi:DNA-binding NarL/FixJ family response regulator